MLSGQSLIKEQLQNSLLPILNLAIQKSPLVNKGPDEKVHTNDDQVVLYRLILTNPLIRDKLFNILSSLPDECHHFLHNNPDYIVVLLGDLETNVTQYKMMPPYDNIDEKYIKTIERKISHKKNITNFHNVFIVINDLFENINATLLDQKYNKSNGYNNQLLPNIREHLLTHFVNPHVKSRLIRNLLLCYPTPQIDLITDLEAYNKPRNMRHGKSKAKRLNVEMEEIIRLACECGFPLHEYFDISPEVNIRVEPHVNASGKFLGSKDYLFNAGDVELNQFTSRFMYNFNDHIIQHNKKPENKNLQFKLGGEPNISFYRIRDDEQQREYILITLSKTCYKTEKNELRPHVLNITRNFIQDYPDKPRFAQLVFVEPGHHTVKSELPLLCRVASMQDDEIKTRLHVRTSRHSLHQYQLIDYFKECAELSGLAFISRTLRAKPTSITIRSASNHYFPTKDRIEFPDHRELCANCKMKTEVNIYHSQAVIARITGMIINELALADNASHSDGSDVKLVIPPRPLTSVDNYEQLPETPPAEKKGGKKRHKNPNIESDKGNRSRPHHFFSQGPIMSDESPLKKSKEGSFTDDDIQEYALSPRNLNLSFQGFRLMDLDLDEQEADHDLQPDSPRSGNP